MGKFGWSYPAGCDGPPDEDRWDDTTCAQCGKDLPEEIQSGTPPFEGFCDEECARSYAGARAAEADREAAAYRAHDEAMAAGPVMPYPDDEIPF